MKKLAEYGKSCETQLHIALQEGSSLETIQSILRSGIDVNFINQNHDTPIFVALNTHFNNNQVIKELLQYGASVNVFNKHGDSTLHVALMKEKKLEIIQYILKFGADVNVKDANGNAPIFKALCSQNENLETIKKLLKHGASVKQTNKFGRTPLYVALHQRKCWKVVQELLNYGSDVNAKNKNGFTPIFESLYSLKILKELLKKGASVLEKSESGYTLLHLAIQVDNVRIVQEILKNGAEVNAKTNSGITPLYTALLSFPPNFEVVKKLLEYGGSIHKCFDLEFSYDVIQKSEMAWEVLKYSLLEHPKDLHCDICEEWSKRTKICIIDCRYEIDNMNDEYIFDQLTLLNFVTQQYDYGKIYSNRNDILSENSTFLQKLDTKYPLYCEIILNRLKSRTYLLRKLCDTSCFIKPKDAVIYLNPLCLQVIGKFLSNEDLMNLIEALNY